MYKKNKQINVIICKSFKTYICLEMVKRQHQKTDKFDSCGGKISAHFVSSVPGATKDWKSCVMTRQNTPHS